MRSMNSTKHTVTNQFNERGVYTGSVVSSTKKDFIGWYPAEEHAVKFCQDLGVEFDVVEGQA